MRSMLWISKYLLALVFCIQIPVPAAAEKITHHGSRVEANGSVTDCLSCHDGAAGKMIGVCTSKCKTSAEHSVMKRYPPRKKAEDYAPVGAVLATGLKIINGKVTCISCHNLRLQNEYHLVISDQGKLCKTCHIRM